MKHARDDYNRIQDPAGLIPEDEPVFLIRGQDRAAIATLLFWADHNIRHGGDVRLSGLALQQAVAMKKWQSKYPPKAADL